MKIHVDHARLDDGDHILQVDLQDLVHMFFHAQYDTAVGRKCAAGKTRPCASGCDDDMIGIAIAQDTAHIILVSGEEYRIRLIARARCVVAVCDEVCLVAIDILFADDLCKSFDVFRIYHCIAPIDW